MRFIVRLITMSLLLLGLSACNSEQKDVLENGHFGKVKHFSNSGCKKESFRTFKADKGLVERITWQATQGGGLQINYHNLKSYCGLDRELGMQTELKGNKLVVSAVKLHPENVIPTYCICRYDLQSELSAFEVGKSYTLIFKKDKWLLGEVNFTYTSDLSGSLVVKK